MRTRLGLKVLGLSALVMGVMAIGTTGAAQAEVNACFGYLTGQDPNLTLTCFGALEPKVKVTFENNTGTLLISNVNFEVLCTSAKFVEGGQLGSGSVTGIYGVLLGKVQFEGCIGLEKNAPLKQLKDCTPKDPVGGTGTIRTEKGYGLIKLHNGEPVLELLPDTGTLLAKIELGEFCGVGEGLEVRGKLVIRDTPVTHEVGGVKLVLNTSKEQFEKHMVSHLIEEHPTLHLMTVGINSALIDGTGVATLESPHNELVWAGKAA